LTIVLKSLATECSLAITETQAQVASLS